MWGYAVYFEVKCGEFFGVSNGSNGELSTRWGRKSVLTHSFSKESSFFFFVVISHSGSLNEKIDIMGVTVTFENVENSRTPNHVASDSLVKKS